MVGHPALLCSALSALPVLEQLASLLSITACTLSTAGTCIACLVAYTSLSMLSFSAGTLLGIQFFSVFAFLVMKSSKDPAISYVGETGVMLLCMLAYMHAARLPSTCD